MIEITSKCKTTKTTLGALDPKEDLGYDVSQRHLHRYGYACNTYMRGYLPTNILILTPVLVYTFIIIF